MVFFRKCAYLLTNCKVYWCDFFSSFFSCGRARTKKSTRRLEISGSRVEISKRRVDLCPWQMRI